MGLTGWNPNTQGVNLDLDKLYLLNGYAFTCDRAAAVETTANICMLITTPADKTVIANFGCESGDGATGTFTEGVTATGGNALSKINRNRASANTSTLTITDQATASGGTLLKTKYLGASSPGASGGSPGAVRAFADWILKPSTKYHVKLVNNDDATQNMRIVLNWMEL